MGYNGVHVQPNHLGNFVRFFIFGQLPDVWTWIATIVIVATALYTLNRERAITQMK